MTETTLTTGRAQRTTLEGHDELGLTSLLEHFQPAPTEDMHKFLSQCAKAYWFSGNGKYATPAEPVEGVYPYAIRRGEVEAPHTKEGVQTIALEQLVPVFIFTNADQTEGFYAVIHREHEARTFRRDADGNLQLNDQGKPQWWDTYLCSHVALADADECADLIRRVRSACEFTIARALGGGVTQAKPEVSASDVAQAAVELGGEHVTARPRRSSNQ